MVAEGFHAGRLGEEGDPSAPPAGDGRFGKDAERAEKELAASFRPLLDEEPGIAFHDLTAVRIHGEKSFEGDIRACGKSEDAGGVARQSRPASFGRPTDCRRRAGSIPAPRRRRKPSNPSRARFSTASGPAPRPGRRPRPPGRDDIGELEKLSVGDGRKLEVVLAVPARGYARLADAFRKIDEGKIGKAGKTGKGRRRWNSPAIAPRSPAIRSARRNGPKSGASGSDRSRRWPWRWSEGSTRRRRERSSSAPGSPSGRRGTVSRTPSRARGREVHPDAALRGTFLLEHRPGRDPEGRTLRRKAGRGDQRRRPVRGRGDLPMQGARRHRARFPDSESEIGIAPAFRRLPERIRARAMIRFLALVLHRVMRMRLKAAGVAASPETVLETLAESRRHRIFIDKRKREGTTPQTPVQKDFFDALKVPEPA